MKIIGHRGASFDAPENTLGSFRLAWRQGADGVELDVLSSGDGKPVVIHDATVLRTTGRRGAVARMSFRHLRSLDAGSWKGERWKGEGIPALAEAARTVPAGRKLFVEIKCGPRILPAVARALDALPPRQVAFVGFSLRTMAATRKAFPDCEVFWNVDLGRRRSAAGWRREADRLAALAKRAGLDGLGPGPAGKLPAAFVRRVRAAGLKLFVWTVDAPARARRLRRLGVEYLVTNRPGWMREQLAR